MSNQSLDSLLELDGVENSTLDDIRDAGFDSLDDVAHVTRNKVMDRSETQDR
jgi:hypothetical protein